MQKFLLIGSIYKTCKITFPNGDTKDLPSTKTYLAMRNKFYNFILVIYVF